MGSEPGAIDDVIGQEGAEASLLCPKATDGSLGKLGDRGG